MGVMINDIAKCKNYLTVLEDIETELDSKNIKYQKTSEHEIVVKDYPVKEIESIILSLPIPAVALYLLIDIVSTKNKIFIRKKMK